MASTADRDRLGRDGQVGHVVVGQREQLGVDDTGVDHHHLDAGLPQVDGHRLGEGGQCGLRGVVGRLAGRAQLGGDGRDVDDGARAAGQHLGQQVVGQAHRRQVVDVHDGRDGVDVERRRVAALGDAGVVDQEVDTAERVQHVDRQLVHRVGVGQVGHPHAAVGRVLHAALQHLGEQLGPAGADADDGAPLGQGLGQPGPDPRGPPGHQRAAPLQVQRHRPPHFRFRANRLSPYAQLAPAAIDNLLMPGSAAFTSG